MFIINEDKSIYITRGDVAFFSIEAKTDTGEAYKFQAGDVVRFKVFEKKACENVVLSKDFGIEAETEEIEIYLEEKDTKIGGVISKPTDYWYEVELNPYTDPQTIVGYDDDGAKVFRLFPEGNEKEDDDPTTPEDIPVVDEELDLTSTRPVQNQAISRAILKIQEEVDNIQEEVDKIQEEVDKIQEEVDNGLTNAKGNRITNVANPIDGNDAVNLTYADRTYAVVKSMVCTVSTNSNGIGAITEFVPANRILLSVIPNNLSNFGVSFYAEYLMYHVKTFDPLTGEALSVDGCEVTVYYIDR